MDWLNRPYLRHFEARMLATVPQPENDAVSAWLDEIARAAIKTEIAELQRAHIGLIPAEPTETIDEPVCIYEVKHRAHVHAVYNFQEVYDGLAYYPACACGCELINGHWYKS